MLFKVPHAQGQHRDGKNPETELTTDSKIKGGQVIRDEQTRLRKT